MFSKRIIILAVSLLSISSFGILFASEMEDTNLAQMKKFYTDVINQGKFDLLDQLCTENFIEHEELPGVKPNREGVKQFFQMYRKAFPDLKFEIEQMIAKDDKVVTYITITGTHKAEFMGVPASGKKINLKGIDIVRFKNGRAVEHWGVTDTMTMMSQIGAIPDKTSKK
jgi:steroid delta-isomerase-like uncharacterized protein